MGNNLPTLAALLAKLDSGAASASSLLDQALVKAAAPAAQAIYTQLFEHTAPAEAKAEDVRRQAGVPVGPLSGLPIAVKDLFDVTGQVTRAGSRLLADQPAATTDSAAVRRLRQAGAIMVGHVNMTEFAYSGLGLNPHYGTPTNPLAEDRIPGGSSSGSAAAVARGAAVAALGTDTGGSVRIPAAFCGLVGFKPTQQRVSRAGVFPLSPTLDSVGPIAPTVACCARMDAVLSGQATPPLQAADGRSLHLAQPTNYVLDGMDATVAAAFKRALQVMTAAGMRVDEMSLDALEHLSDLGHGAGFTAAESYHDHRQWLATRRDVYDPRVSKRIEVGSTMLAADYLALHRRRDELMVLVDAQMTPWDAVVMPTVPIVPPRFAQLDDDTEYARFNRLILRNPTVANMLGLCAISLPCHRAGELPVGLMLVGRAGSDQRLLRIAAAVEALLARQV